MRVVGAPDARVGATGQACTAKIDALHLAFAEHLKADYFVTVDDEILARSQQIQLPVKLLDVVELVKELGL
jgi:predicted nucleic acid-binding protein